PPARSRPRWRPPKSSAWSGKHSLRFLQISLLSFLVDQLIGVGLGTLLVVERFGFGLPVCSDAAEADGDIASVDRDLPEFRRAAFDEFEIPLVAAARRRSARGFRCGRLCCTL